MAGKVYHGFLSGFFLLFLLLPVSAMFVMPAQKVSENEKRALASFPRLERSWSVLGKFPKQFERYFGDHFGFRDQFIGLYNRLFLKLFQTSPHYAVIYGKQGWLFFTVDGVLQDHMGYWSGKNRAVQQFADTLSDRREWLGGLGGRYLFVPVPNKIQVYEEFLPTSYRYFNGNSLYSLLLEKNRSEIPKEGGIDLLTILLKQKDRQMVYYQTDTHWNEMGAYLGYLEIVNWLQRWFPDLVPLDLESLERSEGESPGDLANFFNLKQQFDERAQFLRIKRDCEGFRLVDMGQLKETAGGGRKAGKSAKLEMTECRNLQRTAVVIHDSFGNYVRKYLSQHFHTVYFVTNGNFNDTLDLIEKVRPDVVIDLHVARNIPKALAPARRLTRFGAQKEFHRSRRILLEMTGEQLVDGISAASFNVSPMSEEGKGVFFAQNNDPQFLFSLPGGQAAVGGTLRLEMESPADTRVQVFYRSSERPAFQEQASIAWPVSKGKNELFLRIPKTERFDTLRLDPGKVSGRYLIGGLELRGLD